MGLSTSVEPAYLWTREFAKAKKNNPSLTAREFNQSLKDEAKESTKHFDLPSLSQAVQNGLKKPNVKVG